MVSSKIFGHYAELSFLGARGNALSLELLRDFKQSFQTLSQNEKIKAILIQSEGPVFCSGADLTVCNQLKSHEAAKSFYQQVADLIFELATSPKIVIGRAHGRAVGGGVGLLAAMDYCFATEEAMIRLSELSIGLAPLIISPVLRKRIGKNHLVKMALNPDQWTSVEELKQWGFYQESCGSTLEVNERIASFLITLSSVRREALSDLKQALSKKPQKLKVTLSQMAEKTAGLLTSLLSSGGELQVKKGKNV